VSEFTRVKVSGLKSLYMSGVLIYLTWVTQSGGHLIHLFHILGDQKWWPPLSCLHTHKTHTNTHTHRFIERERERERERSPYHFTFESVVGGPKKYRVKEPLNCNMGRAIIIGHFCGYKTLDIIIHHPL